MRRCTLFVPALLVLGFVAACSSDRATGIDGICDVTNPVSSITVDPPSATLFFRDPPRVSDVLQLKPTAYGRFGAARTDVPFTFSSSNSAVASVDSTGLVTAHTIGNATITVSSCDEDASVNIAVVSELESINVVLPNDTLVVGDSMVVTAQAIAVGGATIGDAVFQWSVDPESVASITVLDDSTVMVNALAEGTVTVTAAIGTTTGSGSLVVIPAATP
ncbi:MAG TPA: Ig-like domain-containing protein [Gemmatimonadaceae bacterium]|nr:Ig-like domain-containing protein [Gemmatimonadaceae bacterium]